MDRPRVPPAARWWTTAAVALLCSGCGQKHLSLDQFAAVLRLQNKTTEPIVVWIAQGKTNSRLGVVSPGRTVEFGIPNPSFGESDFVNFHANSEKAACATPAPFRAARNARADFIARPSNMSIEVAGGPKPPCMISPK